MLAGEFHLEGNFIRRTLPATVQVSADASGVNPKLNLRGSLGAQIQQTYCLPAAGWQAPGLWPLRFETGPFVAHPAECCSV